jgi:hypothetical protein
MKVVAVILFVIACICEMQAQVFTIKDGTVKSGSGMFYDSGGKDGKYSGGENFVFTINRDSEKQNLIMNFTKFSLSEGDWLAVYDGENTDAAQIDVFSNKNSLTGELKASNSALTFVFHSEPGNSAEGWVAQIMPLDEKPVGSNADFHAEEGVVLIYSLKGLKSESDGFLMEQMLAKQEYVIDSEVHMKQENLYVNCHDDSYAFKIKDLIVEFQHTLGYEISIDFMRSVEVAGHGDSH